MSWPEVHDASQNLGIALQFVIKHIQIKLVIKHIPIKLDSGSMDWGIKLMDPQPPRPGGPSISLKGPTSDTYSFSHAGSEVSWISHIAHVCLFDP